MERTRENSVWEAFNKYVVAFREAYRSGKLEGESGLALLGGKLEAIVHHLEKSKEFLSLVREIDANYPKKPHSSFQRVRNFFRRSGFYISVEKNEPQDDKQLFKQFSFACRESKFKRILLAPLEGVSFFQDVLDFDDFQIRRFSQTELSNILSQEINHVFYQNATIDVPFISQYWYLYYSDTIDVGDKFGVTFYFDPKVPLQFTTFSPTIEKMLHSLVLHNWEGELQEFKREDDILLNWLGFNIPISIEIIDCPLYYPSPLPTTEHLKKQYVKNIGESGYEIRPWFYHELNQDQTQGFSLNVNKNKKMLDALQESKDTWPFLTLALGFLTKAFFSNGLEELLWHITTIEALLGQHEEVRKNILTRGKRILAETQEQRKQIRKRFDNLYDIRCDLVHGNVSSNTALLVHLREARSFARQITNWFINFLYSIVIEYEKDGKLESLPRREDILRMIDMDSIARVNTRKLLPKIDEKFPFKQDWLY